MRRPLSERRSAVGYPRTRFGPWFHCGLPPLRETASGSRPLRWRLFAAATWGYLAFVVILAAIIWFGGDRWWLATLFLFGPRWLAALPLAVLSPLAFSMHPRHLWPLLPAVLLLLFGVMGLELSWPHAQRPGETHLRVLSLNCGGELVDNEKLLSLVHELFPDIVLLQECTPQTAALWKHGWHVAGDGELLIVSPYPLTDLRISHCTIPASRWPRANALYARVERPGGAFGVCNVHLRSPRYGLTTVLDRYTLLNPARKGTLQAEIKLRDLESQQLVDWLKHLPPHEIIGGDFNMPVESTLYRQWWSGYRNAFSTAGLGLGFSMRCRIRWLEYGLRIDHILCPPSRRVYRSWIGPDVGSDHLPLVADFAL